MFINKIRIADYSQYQADSCRNGGNYGFDTYYYRVGADSWAVEYTSTADFYMCPFCGSFVNDYDEECSCGQTEAEVISTDKLIKEIEYTQRMAAEVEANEYGDMPYSVQSWSTDEEFGNEVDKKIGRLLGYAC